MVRRHKPREDTHIVHSLDGVAISDECEEADTRDDHDQCDGYIRVMAYRPYCECWCHNEDAVLDI